MDVGGLGEKGRVFGGFGVCWEVVEIVYVIVEWLWRNDGM